MTYAEFQSFLSEPAFSIQETTFCIWRRYIDSSWQVANIQYPAADDPDGSEQMLKILDGRPLTYKEFAEDYYDQPTEFHAIEHIYKHKRLTNEIITTLNGHISLELLAKDVDEIDYPAAVGPGTRT